MRRERVKLGRAFYGLLLARAVSEAGDRALIIALPFAALGVYHSTTSVSVLLVASQAPVLIGYAIVGAIGVRLPRRASLVLSDAGQGCLQMLTFAFLVAGRPSLWVIAVLQASAALMSAVTIPVSEAAVADIVPEQQRARANGALQGVSSVIRIAAPAGAGIVGALAGFRVLFLVDALSFVASFLILVAIRSWPKHAAHAPEGRGVTLRSLRKTLSRRWLVVSSLGAASLNAFTIAPILVIGPGLLSGNSGDSTFWGLAMAALGFGGLVGAVTTMRRRFAFPLRTGFLVAPLICLFPFALAIGAAPGVVLGAAFLAGLQSIIFNSLGQSARQSKLPAHLRVSGSAFASFIAFGLPPIGLLAAGLAVQRVGSTPVMVAAGVIGLAVPITALMFSDVRDLTLAPAETRDDLEVAVRA